MNLYADWIELLKQDLQRRGYAVPSNEPAEQIAFKHANVKLRDIEAIPRLVLRASGFSCPQQYDAALQEIARKATTGEPLTPHLSRRLLDLNFNDRLINDWGIHHLHLGDVVEGDGFIKRTGPLLFALVQPQRFLMIGILPHDSWTDEHLMETVLSNWPDELQRFEMKGVIGLASPVSPAERAKLRAANVGIPLQLSNGKVYVPPGGGPATSGISSRIVQREIHWRHTLRNVEEFIRSNLHVFSASMPPEIRFADPPHFRLVARQGDTLWLREEGSGHHFRLPLS
ncbi:hypothetical protein POL25_23785 [Nannocystis sp. bb15-2]|uniref:Uncharacterized protein n=1 Tax=Nannocystis bainbridge TaxID=2995303 RepID=A0ABT5E5B2_9BACT|nr:hypothetical protein [Nannocystis bainbridge]